MLEPDGIPTEVTAFASRRLIEDDETEEVSDPGQVLMPSLDWLAERYPAFGELVRSGVSGRTFAWDDAAGAYVDTGPYVEEE
ncbi:MAG: hypothetical protein J2P24_09875 [Streptosporangiales bacterium]|nr:hypothetical protein [Streptosporangiales bacterium]MBO0890755.1 hypothetical protein [Acidothermales bacterium]